MIKLRWRETRIVKNEAGTHEQDYTREGVVISASVVPLYDRKQNLTLKTYLVIKEDNGKIVTISADEVQPG